MISLRVNSSFERRDYRQIFFLYVNGLVESVCVFHSVFVVYTSAIFFNSGSFLTRVAGVQNPRIEPHVSCESLSTLRIDCHPLSKYVILSYESP